MMNYLYDRSLRIYRIPPFLDAHMHFMNGGRTVSSQEVSRIGKAYAKCGIFAVNDMGHRSGFGFAAKSLLSGKIGVRTAGFAIYKTGGYGEFLGKGVKDREGIKKVVDEIADAGADFIKVINSGVVSFRGMPPVTSGGFTLEELKAISVESKERKLEMVCHADADRAIRDAVVAGAASIEHGFFVSKETLKMMADSEVSWTPTVFALLITAGSLPDGQRRYIEEVIKGHLLSIRYACAAGVKLRVGTDSGSKGVDHGTSYFDELRLFRRAGLSDEQIVAAACMDMSEIEKGNFVLVKEDFVETGKIEAVYRAGKPLTID